jgi:hypothetical protein
MNEDVEEQIDRYLSVLAQHESLKPDLTDDELATWEGLVEKADSSGERDTVLAELKGFLEGVIFPRIGELPDGEE